MTLRQAGHRGLHPWHDIATGASPPSVVNAIIEIPTNERNKYELDKEYGIFRLDRVWPVRSTIPVITASSPVPSATTATLWTSWSSPQFRYSPAVWWSAGPSASFTWWTAAKPTKRCSPCR